MAFSFDDIAADLEIMQLRSPLAPGLHLAFGRWTGRLPAITLLATGKGEDAAPARAGCIGEMVENLSIGNAAHSRPVWVDLADGRLDARSLDLSDPDDLGSEGCAAHVDPFLAQRAAILERVERAALALCWQGRAATTEIAVLPMLVDNYRQGATDRWSRCWRIEVIAGIFSCLVLTGNADYGPLVMGSAASTDPAQAIEAALAEALLSEIALLAPPDHPDHRNALILDVALRAKLGDLGPPAGNELPAQVAGADPLDLCRAAGHQVFLADLTHPALGLPVWRAVIPSLPRWRPILHSLQAQGFDD